MQPYWAEIDTPIVVTYYHLCVGDTTLCGMFVNSDVRKVTQFGVERPHEVCPKCTEIADGIAKRRSDEPTVTT